MGIVDEETIKQITTLLKQHPKGLMISDFSTQMKINRNIMSKYLDICSNFHLTRKYLMLPTVHPRIMLIVATPMAAESGLKDHSTRQYFPQLLGASLDGDDRKLMFLIKWFIF